MKAKFERGTDFNRLIIAFTGQYVVFPTTARFKKQALLEAKRRLHRMVEEL